MVALREAWANSVQENRSTWVRDALIQEDRQVLFGIAELLERIAVVDLSQIGTNPSGLFNDAWLPPARVTPAPFTPTPHSVLQLPPTRTIVDQCGLRAFARCRRWPAGTPADPAPTTITSNAPTKLGSSDSPCSRARSWHTASLSSGGTSPPSVVRIRASQRP